MQQVYLDAASAEPLHPAARAVLDAASERGFADPRRLHGPGRDARLLLDNAREVVAESLGVRREEVIFTSSGTSAVHAGLLGLLDRDRQAAVALSEVEHQSVAETVRWAGIPTLGLAVDAFGRIQPPDPDSGGAVTTADVTAADVTAADVTAADVKVVAVQQANHEVGTVQPVAALAESFPGAEVFTDACAAMGRLPLPQGWTVAAGSAHKWGGPTGVGVLVVRKQSRWTWPGPGDRFARTEHGFTNVPGALAAAAALQAVVAEREETNAHQFDLIDRIRTAAGRMVDVDVVGDPTERLPHLVTFSFLYVDGEALVTTLDRLGFAVASGSACAADTREPSRVLAAMGALSHGNVRVSLTRTTTSEDVDRFLSVLPGVVGDLRAEVGL